ncbi:uncharacterized protein DSM5745_04455 [Aspergillus mulundensis]|uniref:Uncharacterized protein n=1 Tax=Aspergillus mulundensis TaxID=1810919 RepID=A0A3D8SCV1_9EURO|nr:hypothetical protein DSM5745_04455 [Aspergillus mulundensis]RDW84129.1 hypothetical protein DSM5745_04455 [Aspergillus mulundensis]
MYPLPLAQGNPQTPSDATIQKWLEGATNPASLTFTDRQKLLRRHPWPESDALCKETTGLSFDQLTEKAAHSDPATLTYGESWLLAQGTSGVLANGDKQMLDRVRWPAPARAAYDAALEAILSETDRAARANARVALARHRDGYWGKRKEISVQDRRNAEFVSSWPWMHEVEEMLAADAEARWGFVCFRTAYGDDAQWEHFKTQFANGAELSLSMLQSARSEFWTPDVLLGRWEIQFVEDREALEGAGLHQLCLRFRRMREEGRIRAGLRRDVFLYANQASIQSSLDHYPLPDRGFVVAGDPEHEPGKIPTYLHNFKGNVRVAFTGVFTCFYARLIPRGDPEDDPSMIRGNRQSWDVVFLKARMNREDKTYPPASQNNRN